MAWTLNITSEGERQKAMRWLMKAPYGMTIRFLKAKRTIPQNDKMWAVLSEVSAQARHNGVQYSPEDWKALFMHGCGHETRFITGLSGEPFPAGFRSSKLNKEQMSELLEFIHCWCAENGVTLADERAAA